MCTIKRRDACPNLAMALNDAPRRLNRLLNLLAPSGGGVEHVLRGGSGKMEPTDIQMGGIWFGPFSGQEPDMSCSPTADATIHAALALGIRDFDTAPMYGSGRCEERMGHALNSVECPVPLSEIRVTTKSGRLMREGGSEDGGYFWEQRVPAPVVDPSKHLVDYTFAGARLSLQESLVRLGNGAADGSAFVGLHSLRVHDPNDTGYDRRGPYSPDDIDACLAPGGHLEGLVGLRTAGLIQEVSLGMNSVGFNEVGEDRAENVLRLIRGAPAGTFDSALLAYGYNLFNQDGVEIMLECEKRGIAVHVAGAFMMGVFDTTSDTKAPPPGGSNKSESTAQQKQQWATLAKKHDVPLPSVALAFAFAPKVVTKIVLGMANPEQVADNMKYVEGTKSIPAALWDEARALGLVAPGIPTPT